MTGQQRPRQRLPKSSGRPSYPFPARPQQQSTTAIEDTIFAATEELLNEMPFSELTVADILERAGVSRTTFYRYFTSKELVVSAMLRVLHMDSVGLMRPWWGRGGRTPMEGMTEALTAAADYWARHRALMRACSESWHSGPEIGEPYVALLDNYVADIANQIDQERRIGAAPPGADSRMLALFLAWGCERMFYMAGFGVFGPELEMAIVDAVVAIWMSTIYKE